MKKGHVISIGLLALVATVALAQTVFSSLRVNGQSDLRGSIVNGTGNVTVADDFDVDVGGGTDELNVASGLVTVPGDLTVSGTCTGCGGGVAQSTGNFTISLTNACSTTPTQVINWVLTGSIVTMRITQDITAGTCTGDSTSFATAAGDVPVSLRPAARLVIPLFTCVDSGANVGCGVQLSTDGTWSYCVQSVAPGYPACVAANWTASGNRAMVATGSSSGGNVFSYPLN